MFRTPKRSKGGLSNSEVIDLTPPNKIFCVRNSTDSVENSPVIASPGSASALSPSETRRGRPRAEVLNTLILQGSSSPSSIKCTFCNRVFPREKSLQAHLRTHTGEKPYACDYPRCTRRFAQSGQLKTHQRLHTGEKPFICSAPNCDRKFTHANRHCPEHPEMQLKRVNSTAPVNLEKVNDEEHSHAVQKWLDGVKKRDKCPNSITPKKNRPNDENSYSNQTIKTKSLSKNFDNCTSYKKAIKVEPTDSSPNNQDHYLKEYASAEAMIELHKGAFNNQQLLPLQDTTIHYTDNEIHSTQKSALEYVPKKRWLREAVLEQQKWDCGQDLAKPINWGDEMNIIEYENQKRPTVLVRVDQSEKKEVSRKEMQTAIALVELGNTNGSASGYQF